MVTTHHRIKESNIYSSLLLLFLTLLLTLLLTPDFVKYKPHELLEARESLLLQDTVIDAYFQTYVLFRSVPMSDLAIAMESRTECKEGMMELIWQDALRHLDYSNNEIFLPPDITGIISEQSIDEIKHRLS